MNRYVAAALNPSGESADKIEAIHALEPHLAHPGVRTFLAALLRDPAEYDLARIETCKLLEVAAPDARAAEYAVALLAVLAADGEDVLVRQWAARGLRAFVGQAEVVRALKSVADDPAEDEDVRANAVAALRAV